MSSSKTKNSCEFSDDVKSGEIPEKKKWANEITSFLEILLSIRNSFVFVIVLLVFGIAIIGTVGTVSIVSFSFSSSSSQRESSFGLVSEKVKEIVLRPKILVDSAASGYRSGVISLDNSSVDEIMEYMWYMGSTNYERFEMKSWPFFFSDAGFEKYQIYYFYEDGSIEYYRKGAGELELDQCNVNKTTGKCTGEIRTTYLTKNESIVAQSEFIYEPKYSNPYLFWCPGDKCDLLIAYTNPYHVNGKYFGCCGFSLDSRTIKSYLVSQTISQATSFIIDLNGGYLYSTSSDDPVLISRDGMMSRVIATECGNSMIEKLSEIILNTYHNDNLESGDSKAFTIGTTLVDYVRFEKYGLNWVICSYTSSWTYFSSMIIFVSLFSVLFVSSITVSLFFGILLPFIIRADLDKLSGEMEKAEYLHLNGISKTKSKFKEIKDLDKSFQFLVSKLKEYSAFLPESIKNKAKGIYTSDELRKMKGSTSSQGTGSSGKKKKKKDNDSSQTNSTNQESDSIEITSISSNTETLSVSNSNLFGNSISFQENHITPRDCSLVLISFNGKKDKTQYWIQAHSEFTQNVRETCKRGTLYHFSEKEFRIEFNLNKKLNLHFDVALQSAVDIHKKCCDSYNFHVSVATGMVNVGVLGTLETKQSVIFGNTVDRLEILNKHCQSIDAGVLVGKECVRRLKAVFGNGSDEYRRTTQKERFLYTPIDEIIIGKRKEKVYVAEYLLQAHSSEWMYTLDFEKECRKFKKENKKIWEFIINSKFKEALEEMKEMERFSILKQFVEEMIKKKTTYRSACEEKQKKLKNKESLSVFV